MAVQATEKRVFRSRSDAYLGGVCAGIAERFELDTIVVRILAVLLAGLTLGLAGIVYIALWVRLPLERESSTPYDVMPESAESSAFGCVDCLQSAKGCSDDDTVGSLPLVARLAVAAGLAVLFLAVSLNVSPMLPGTQWWQFWPLIMLMAGLCLIIIPIRTRLETAWHALGIVLTSLAASLLPMTLGIMSWATVNCAVVQFWPIAVLSVALWVVGLYRRMGILVLAGAFSFVAFCLMGLTFCMVPGEIEAFFLQMPTGRSFRIAFM